jgi:hypothetical protein
MLRLVTHRPATHHLVTDLRVMLRPVIHPHVMLQPVTGRRQPQTTK